MKSQRGFRNAFTLIETMIAMSLLSLLMAITWTMFSIYTKLESKGVARAEEAGLVRAISRQIRHDLLHVVGVDKRRGVSLNDKSAPEANQFSANGYLVGTSTDLHFIVCRDAESVEATDVVRVISYEPHSIIDSETDELGQAETEIDLIEPLATAFTDEYETPLGIDRHDRSWIDYWEDRTLDDSSDDVLSTNRPIALQADDFIQVGKQSFADGANEQRFIEVQNVTDEIPELARLNLRYFDGESWTSQWDSTTKGRLPLAIEIGFDLQVVNDIELDADRDDVVPIDTDGTTLASSEGTSKSLATSDTGTITVGDQDETVNASLTEYRFIVSIPAASAPERRDRESEDAGDSEDAELSTESLP